MIRNHDPERKDPKKVAAGHLGGTAKAATPEEERAGWKTPAWNPNPVLSRAEQEAAIREGRPGRMPGIKSGSDRWAHGIGPKGSKYNPIKKRPTPGSAKSGCPKNVFFNTTLMSYKTMESNRNRVKGGKVRNKKDPEFDPLPFSTAEFRAEVLRQAVSASEAKALEDARWVCPYTGKNFGLDEFACDHLIPRSRGGPDTLDNLVVCRKVANKAKGALTAKEFEEILIPMRRWPDDRMDKTLRQMAAGASIQSMWFRKNAAEKAAAKAGGAA